MGNTNEKIVLYFNRKACEIDMESIEYIKAYAGESSFKAGNMMFRKRISLNDLEDMLDENIFIRINKSYIVNINKCEYNIRSGEIKVGGLTLKVSRRKKSYVDGMFINYLTR